MGNLTKKVIVKADRTTKDNEHLNRTHDLIEKMKRNNDNNIDL